VEMLQSFDFSTWPPPPSWIFIFAKFYWLTGSREPRLITLQNLVKICYGDIAIFHVFKMAAIRRLVFGHIWTTRGQ